MESRPVQFATSSRKEEHVAVALTHDVGFRHKTTGLEEWEFVHNALPELDYADVRTEQVFLGKTIAAPFLVSCMTGGYAGAEAINRELAEACAEFAIAMGVGSQRQALESEQFHESFRVARRAAPTIPLIANIGASHVREPHAYDTIAAAVEMIAADALAVHLNPAQEIVQQEGTPHFKGVLAGIERLCAALPVPVIVKEIGAGISADVACRLAGAGVRYIDVAGAGGTSWTGVEMLRHAPDSGNTADAMAPFWDWGIRTADAIRAVRSVFENGTVIGSGGIANGLDAAKAVALGADMAAAARPFLRALDAGGASGLRLLLASWVRQFRTAMFLTGSATIAELRRAAIHHAGEAAVS